MHQFEGLLITDIPASTGHSPNAVSMLAHRLRRSACPPNIETALGECPVFAGISQDFKQNCNIALSAMFCFCKVKSTSTKLIETNHAC